MKKSFLITTLAVAIALVAQQPAAAKNSKGATKTTASAKKHHKKHTKKTASMASSVAEAVRAA